MTIRALIGLAGFNLALLGVGSALLWGLGTYRRLTDFIRLAGVAYLVGFAGVIVVLSLELAVGVPVNGVTGVLSLLALAILGVWPALRRSGSTRPAPPAPGWRFPRISLVVAVSLAGIVLYFEGLLRQARLATTLPEWDGWSMWIPKAKAIFYVGHLDPEFLSFLPNMPYPPGLPAVHAFAFHAMGSADDVTLHVQYWFYAVGFVAALAGLLAQVVRPAIFVPLLFLVLLAPYVVTWSTRTYADLPLGYLVATAAVLLLLWVEERRPWYLVAASVLLSAAMLTKREGILFAACVLLAAAAAAAAAGKRRACWPRLALAGTVAVAFAMPWRVWLVLHRVPGEGPSAGFFRGVDDLGRAWDSARLAVSALFEPVFWGAAPRVAVAAIGLAFLARAWSEAVFAATFAGLALLAATWVVWAEQTLPITTDDALNPIVRMTGTSILVLSALAPLLLERAWSAHSVRGRHVRGRERFGFGALGRESLAAWAIVAVAALAYPASMLVGYSGHGLPAALPRFPSVSDCIVDPAPGERARVVVGYAGSYPEAYALRARAANAGLPRARVSHDGCGRLRVYVGGLPTPNAARPILQQARTAGLEATLERES